jgi:hypothetical protein
LNVSQRAIEKLYASTIDVLSFANVSAVVHKTNK